MDYFIKAADEAELRRLLVEAGVLVEIDGDYAVTAYAIDIIGQIAKPTGEKVAVEGGEADVVAPIPGYHANLRGELSDEQVLILAPILLPEPPANPVRVWA